MQLPTSCLNGEWVIQFVNLSWMLVNVSWPSLVPSWDSNHVIQTHQLSNKENGFCHENKGVVPCQLLGKCTHNCFKWLHNTVGIEQGREQGNLDVRLPGMEVHSVMFLKSSCVYGCMFLLTLRSLFPAHPCPTVAGSLMCGPVPERSVKRERRLKSWLRIHTDIKS